MSVADELAVLASVDEVEALVPTDSEATMGTYPSWCELVLSIKRFDDGSLKPAHPLNARLPLKRHDGELIMQVLWDVLHPRHELAAVDQMYDALDKVVNKIQKRVNKGKEPLAGHVGEARGLALAIATMLNPVDPDIEEVREVAMLRWEARHEPA